MSVLSVYEVNVGAYYWVVARSMRQALELSYAVWEAEGCLEDVESSSGLSVEKVPPERLRKLRLLDEDETGSLTFQEVLEDYQVREECGVFSCSEWP